MNDQNSPDDTGRQLVYFAAERTLMSWVRTALSMMALGFVIDRFGLALRQMFPSAGPDLHSEAFSFWAGTVLVLVGSAMCWVAAGRYLRFTLAYRRAGTTRTGNGILLGLLFTVVAAVLGIVIAVFLLTATG